MPLIVPNQPQSGCHVKDRLGQNAHQQEPNLVDRQRRCQFFESDPQPHLAHGRYPILEGGRILVQLICCHPLERQSHSIQGLLQQVQGDLRFGFEGQVFRHAACPAFLGMFVVKPLRQHEQTTGNDTL
jgi:hypothetical protein